MYYRFTPNDTTKVIFDINSFSYGNIIINKTDISKYLFSIDKNIAEEYSNKYNEIHNNHILVPKINKSLTEEEINNNEDDKKKELSVLIANFYLNVDLENSNVITEIVN